MRKNLLALLTLINCLITVCAFGQITFDTIDSGPYGQESSIAVPIKIQPNAGAYPIGNIFTLWISGPNGSFAQERQIGTYSGFFTTFINGRIPAGYAAGTYKLRIKSSSNPNIFVIPQDIQVLAVRGPVAATSATSNLLAPDTYGWCGSAIAENKSIVFRDNSEAPAVQRLTLKNELTGTSQEYAKGPAGYSLTGLPEAYYTVTVNSQAVVSGQTVKSTHAYLLLNTPGNISVSGIGYGCIDKSNNTGANVTFQVDTQTPTGFKNHYPGMTYRITWGDGTTEVITYPVLMSRAGALSHSYFLSSCGQPPIDLGNGTKQTNAFKLTVTAVNPYCGSETNSFTTYPKIYTKPIAQIDPITAKTTCLNVPVVITNTSKQGTNADCSLSTIYEWYVDGVLVSTEPALKYTFNTTGLHKIRLVAKNDIELCQPSEDQIDICVQAPPQPSFNLGAASPKIMCLTETLKPNNTSIIDNNCNQDNTYQWIVTGGAVGFADGTSASSKEPVFKFSTPGVYQVKLAITTASCGLFTTPEQTVIVNGPATSQLSPAVQLCNLGVYHFDDTTPGPTKTTLTGTFTESETTYTWKVTGGNFSFADGTGPNSKFPHIEFKDYATYTVSVTQKNNCTESTATQQLTFITAPVVQAGPSQTICFDQSAKLQASISGDNIVSAAWVGGQGTFSPNRQAYDATYTPTAAERATGKVDLTFHVTTTLADPCTSIDAFTTINITPQVLVTSPANLSTCRNLPLNYTITSNVPGTLFSWTATGSATAGGFQSSGTGSSINDVLTNSNPQIDAQVVYTITPVNGNCSGTPFQLTVTIAEIKNTISNPTPVVCSGQEVNFTGSTPTGGNNSYTYSWQRSTDGTNWQVIDGATGKDLNITLTETQYIQRLVSSGDCGAVSNSIQISVLPPLSNNSIGGDQNICSGNAATVLTGTQPAGGDGNYSYQWQFSLDAGLSWNNIEQATSKDFTPGAITKTSLYRRLVSTTSCSGKLQSTSNSIQVKVNEAAMSTFTFTADKSCAPFVIDAKNIVATAFPDRNETYTWLVNNQVIGTGLAFPGYTIQNDLTSVVVSLITTSPFNCSADTLSHTFSTEQRITASFSQDVTQGCGTTTVQFKNTTPVLAGTTYLWNFGNGNTATAADPAAQSYLPNPSGRDTTYVVTLTVNSNCGSTTQSAQVLVRALPRSVFSPNKTTGCSPLLVSFSNTSPGDANTYIYDFGDGTPLLRTTSKTGVTHTYVSGVTKDYVVKMTTENACGTSQPTQYTIRITPNTILPELVVNSTELQGCAPLTVNFQNNSTGASSFTYDFGDGTTTGPTYNAPETITHTFTKPGTYVVKLRATNGCSDTTTTETITVYEQPELLFSAEQRVGCPGLSVKFSNQSTGAVSYRWNFGDGSPESTESEPVHVYNGDQEYYSVTLTALNGRGCENSITVSQFVHIIPPPVARFDVNPSTVIAVPNYTFQFEDQSTGTVDKWAWDFGDGTSSSERNPSHIYADTGSYQVTLRVSNAESCSTSTSKRVQITGVPGYLYVPNAFMPNSSTPELREFRVKGSGIASWTLQIYNKWGELLWQTSKLEDGRPAESWDGMYKSALLPQGVYFWKIDVQMINGIPWKGMSYNGSTPKRTGVINLIR